MLASTSTASTALVTTSSTEAPKHLYRTILQQARLLASTLDDAIVYKSHRFIARKNLEPLLHTPVPPRSETPWPLPTSVKRLLRAKTHRRHLADANFGWEHAVHRALSLAYARSGKLRRDVLSDFSPTRSSSPTETRCQNKPSTMQFSPVLLALLTSGMSMNGTPVKSVSHLTGRPPPPYLPSVDDPLVKYFGKAMGKRRMRNASKKFVRTYLRKVKVPLDTATSSSGINPHSVFAHLETKAKPPSQHISNFPSRFIKSRNISTPPHDAMKTWLKRSMQCWLQARRKVEMYRSNMDSSAHRKRSLRLHGWSSYPKDFSHPRTLRRIYGRILDDTPLLLINNTTPHSQEFIQPTTRRNDPLHIRSHLGTIPHDLPHSKLTPVKSRYAIGPANTRAKGDFVPQEAARMPHEWLDTSEVELLRQSGLM